MYFLIITSPFLNLLGFSGKHIKNTGPLNIFTAKTSMNIFRYGQPHGSDKFPFTILFNSRIGRIQWLTSPYVKYSFEALAHLLSMLVVQSLQRFNCSVLQSLETCPKTSIIIIYDIWMDLLSQVFWLFHRIRKAMYYMWPFSLQGTWFSSTCLNSIRVDWTLASKLPPFWILHCKILQRNWHAGLEAMKVCFRLCLIPCRHPLYIYFQRLVFTF